MCCDNIIFSLFDCMLTQLCIYSLSHLTLPSHRADRTAVLQHTMIRYTPMQQCADNQCHVSVRLDTGTLFNQPYPRQLCFLLTATSTPSALYVCTTSRLIECARDRAAGRKPEPQQPLLLSMKAPRDNDSMDTGEKDDPVKIAKTVLYSLAVTKDMEFAKTLCRVSSQPRSRSHDQMHATRVTCAPLWSLTCLYTLCATFLR